MQTGELQLALMYIYSCCRSLVLFRYVQDARILDVNVVPVLDDKLDSVLDQTLTLCLRQVGDKTALQLLSLSTMEAMFEVVVANGTQLARDIILTEEHRMYFVEPQVIDDAEQLLLRCISETDPTARLRQLLAKGKLQEAQSFAKQFGLDEEDVQKQRLELIRASPQSYNAQDIIESLKNVSVSF
jgi:hypothetical protein